MRTIEEINAEIRRITESVNLDDPASKETARRRIRELLDERRRIYEAALAERRVRMRVGNALQRRKSG